MRFSMRQEKISFLRSLHFCAGPCIWATVSPAIGSLLFGGALVMQAKILLRRPTLILTPKGFMDNSSVHPAGFVPWGGVKDVSVVKDTLTVRINDPAEYYVALSPVAQQALNAGHPLTYAPILPKLPWHVPPEEACKLMQKYLDAYRKRNPNAAGPEAVPPKSRLPQLKKGKSNEKACFS